MTDRRTNHDHDPADQTAKPKRRRFSDEYKLRILEEADRCTESGELGLLLRREGLCSSSLAASRRWRRDHLPEHPESKKPASENRLRHEIQRLKRDKARLQLNLDHAEKIAALQRKYAEMIETAETEPPSEPSPGRSSTSTPRHRRCRRVRRPRSLPGDLVPPAHGVRRRRQSTGPRGRPRRRRARSGAAAIALQEAL